MKLLQAIPTCLLLSPLAVAQDFNLDVGPNLILWPAPSASYGAGAGQTGTWNAVPPSLTPKVLVDLTGATTAVTVVTDRTSSYTYPFGGLTGDDDAFTSDGQALDAVLQTPALWTFSGLSDGDYDVYTYAWDNAGNGSLTDVSLPGVPGSTQTVGGSWGGSPHVLGTTYALHQVLVVGGALVIEAKSTFGGSSGQVIGFQLVKRSSHSPFQAFCAGDGSGTPCPCGNGAAPGEGCANSSGAGGRLSATGTPSVALDDMVLHASQLLPGQPALLFAGNNAVAGGAGAIFGDGLRCAGGGLARLGVRVPNGLGAASWGPGLGASGGWSAGQVRRFQAWYRDPVGSPCGSGFNLSNGLEVTFGA